MCYLKFGLVTRWFNILGHVLSLAAVVGMLGGHWAALQTYAWAQMFANFSRNASVSEAVRMTFDGQHPCQLCLKVAAGTQNDREKQRHAPWLNSGRKIELFWETRAIAVPPAPVMAKLAVPFIQIFQSDFKASPPTPPPRESSGA